MADLTAFQSWIAEASAAVTEHADELTELDRAIGDGDHGINMARGFARSAELAEEEDFASIEAYLKKVGMTLVSTVGGASGPLYGTFFLRMAGPLGASENASPAALAQALRAGVGGIVARGKAEVGDKTMYDAFAPALDAFERAVRAGESTADSLEAAAQAGARGRDDTIALIARKGRASYLGERSAGHMDPGASSAVLLLEAAARTLG